MGNKLPNHQRLTLKATSSTGLNIEHRHRRDVLLSVITARSSCWAWDHEGAGPLMRHDASGQLPTSESLGGRGGKGRRKMSYLGAGPARPVSLRDKKFEARGLLRTDSPMPKHLDSHRLLAPARQPSTCTCKLQVACTTRHPVAVACNQTPYLLEAPKKSNVNKSPGYQETGQSHSGCITVFRGVEGVSF